VAPDWSIHGVIHKAVSCSVKKEEGGTAGGEGEQDGPPGRARPAPPSGLAPEAPRSSPAAALGTRDGGGAAAASWVRMACETCHGRVMDVSWTCHGPPGELGLGGEVPGAPQRVTVRLEHIHDTSVTRPRHVSRGGWPCASGSGGEEVGWRSYRANTRCARRKLRQSEARSMSCRCTREE